MDRRPVYQCKCQACVKRFGIEGSYISRQVLRTHAKRQRENLRKENVNQEDLQDIQRNDEVGNEGLLKKRTEFCRCEGCLFKEPDRGVPKLDFVHI